LGILGAKTPVVYLVIFGLLKNFINLPQKLQHFPHFMVKMTQINNCYKKGKKISINTSYKHKMSIISLVDQIKTEKVKNSKRLKRLKGQKRLEV